MVFVRLAEVGGGGGALLGVRIVNIEKSKSKLDI